MFQSEPMNPEIKAKWLAALRSGEYKQGRNRLRTNVPGAPQYCCLGVLCELAVEAGVVDRTDPELPVSGLARVGYYGRAEDISHVLPPASVVKWAGLAQDDGAFRPSDRSAPVTLASLNDRGETFEYIARVIEENF